MLRLSLFLIVLISIFPAYSALITPDEALSRVNKGRYVKTDIPASPKLQSTRLAADGLPAIYIFSYSGEEGFLLVSADDAVVPLLGYSVSGRFSSDDMPESMKWWIGMYEEQIEASRTLPPVISLATRASEREAIQPMLKTQWDQGSPYNLQCPGINGFRSVTGCVATAMAQVMNYWEYPSSGKGSVTFRPSGMDEDLSMNFSEVTFDWGNMLDIYKGNVYSAAQAQAVAELMKACGYSVRMDYGVRLSGALIRDVQGAMRDYFGYDQGISRKERSNYSQDSWNNLIYEELSTTGPVIYGGQSSNGGHCFICDGYDGNGYFHINWGWSGLSDGYYLLNELTPPNVGTGGHYGGYNMRQEVITGIMPPVGRMSLIELSIDNADADSGNLSGWGYTYRVSDFSNIRISLTLRVGGGHISSPLYVTVYEMDPETKKNSRIVYDSTFPDRLNLGEGVATYTAEFGIDDYDVSKIYTLYLAYDLKGQRTVIGNLRLAASSGVGDIFADGNDIEIKESGRIISASGKGPIRLSLYTTEGLKIKEAYGAEPSIDTVDLPSGIIIATARAAEGETVTRKLHLR